jgi:hypothetical protein
MGQMTWANANGHSSNIIHNTPFYILVKIVSYFKRKVLFEHQYDNLHIRVTL